VFNEILIWKQGKSINTTQLKMWVEKGMVFPGSNAGYNALLEAEKKKVAEIEREKRAGTTFSFPSNIAMFVNVGTNS